MTATTSLNFRRLINQKIASTGFKKPWEIIKWMGAMQAQEYAMAKWAVGLRLGNTTDSEIEKAFNAGKILRTHLLRPTWHFVAPEDIRWMHALTSPQILSVNKSMVKKLELDDKILDRAASVIAKQLEGNNFLTRDELNIELKKKKITADSLRLSYMVMYAEQKAIICSGPRKGNQFTYALLDERAPKQKKISRPESLVKLAGIYFKSRGPATIKDFSTWSGLSLKDCRTGFEGIKKELEKEIINGNEYYFEGRELPSPKKLQTSFLMPDYDEYGMSYKDRSSILPSQKIEMNIRGDNPVFNRMIIIDGVICGTWKRTFSKNNVQIDTYPFEKLSAAKEKKLNGAVKKFKLFLEK